VSAMVEVVEGSGGATSSDMVALRASFGVRGAAEEREQWNAEAWPRGMLEAELHL
jgi:hypothetical protein